MDISPLKKILIITRELTLGGAAYLTLRYAKQLITYFQIDFLITGLIEEKMLNQLPKEIRIFSLNALALENQINLVEFFIRHKEIEVFQSVYSAVLATSVFPDWTASMALRLVNAEIKFLFLVDESLSNTIYSEIESLAINDCLKTIDYVIPVSKRLWEKAAIKYKILNVIPFKVLHPLISVDDIILASQKPISNFQCKRPLVVTVARLVPDKQILESLYIHYQLKKKGASFSWVIVGVGPEEDKIRDKIKELKMEDDFILTGSPDFAYAWMKRCDIFALFSASEGCPTVVIEALYLGCPVIMTDVNGADELIIHEKTGLIVSNKKNKIVQNLEYLVQNRQFREIFRQNLKSSEVTYCPTDKIKWLVKKVNEPVNLISDTPKVSILIPTYNQEVFIDKAIASALMQDFKSIEIIVSDDASTDATQKIVSKWLKHPRFKYFRNKYNIGRVKNYHKALTEYARGEWVLLLDGDDYLIDPNFISKAYESLENNAQYSPVFAQAGHRAYHLSNSQKNTDILPSIKGNERIMAAGEYLHFVFKTNFFTHLGALYNRKKAIASQFYTRDISSTDMASLLNLSLEGAVVVLNTIAGCWVQHEKNASSHLPMKNILENIVIFREIAKKAHEAGIISFSAINKTLTYYELDTTDHLFFSALRKNKKSIFDAYDLYRYILSLKKRILMSYFLLRLKRYFYRKYHSYIKNMR